MKLLNDMRLSVKLPILIMSFCLVAALAVTLSGFLSFRAEALRAAEGQFATVAESRATKLQSWMTSISEDLVASASNLTTIEALRAFRAAWQQIEGDPRATLQAAYIDANPHPVGEKHLLDRAPEPTTYNRAHGRYHDSFRALQQGRGYYDVFLLDPEGRLIYSVFKEPDYATDFRSGPYADSGLGAVFRGALEAAPGEVVYDDFRPYAPSADAPAAFIGTQVTDAAGELLGVLAFQMPIDRLAAIVDDPTGLGQSGEIVVLGSDRTARSASRHGEFGLLDTLPALGQYSAAFAAPAGPIREAVGPSGAPVIAYATMIDVIGTPWGVVGEIDLAEVMAPVRRAGLLQVGLAVLCAVVLSGLGVLVARTLSRPIAQGAQEMQRVADGDYAFAVSNIGRGDEVGDIARSLGYMQDRLASAADAETAQRLLEAQKVVVQRLSEALTNLAEGDLTRPIVAELPEEYAQLREDYNLALTRLHDVLSQVAVTAEQIGERASELVGSSEDLAGRTESQATTLAQTAAALEQMTQNVSSTAEGAKAAMTFVSSARRHAQESSEVVTKAVEAMNHIEASSSRISKIVAVIEDIAFQTNLLALNAGVEAARAGPAGRGFAVVASEVRALAHRSADSAKEIKGLIQTSGAEIESGVGLVRKAGEALVRINEQVAQITTQVGEIANGADEQATGLREINTGVTHLDGVTQQNAAMVEQTAAASEALRTDAGTLTRQVGRFTLRPADRSGPVEDWRMTA